jgi:replication factor C subunit 3/5
LWGVGEEWDEGRVSRCEGVGKEDCEGEWEEFKTGVVDVWSCSCSKVNPPFLSLPLFYHPLTYPLSEKVTNSTPIPPPDWEALLSVIASEINAEHSPARILLVRAKLYDLLTHCIPPTTILKVLTFKLIPLVDDQLKAEIIKWSAFYEHRIRMGTKVIFHLEAFVAKFMRVVEEFEMGMDF